MRPQSGPFSAPASCSGELQSAIGWATIMSMIEFRSVCKDYQRRRVIDMLSMQIEAKERVVLFGPSGCLDVITLGRDTQFVPLSKRRSLDTRAGDLMAIPIVIVQIEARGNQPTPKLGEWVEVLTEILEKEAKLLAESGFAR
jgi:hypothetical protein